MISLSLSPTSSLHLPSFPGSSVSTPGRSGTNRLQSPTSTIPRTSVASPNNKGLSTNSQQPRKSIIKVRKSGQYPTSKLSETDRKPIPKHFTFNIDEIQMQSDASNSISSPQQNSPDSIINSSSAKVVKTEGPSYLQPTFTALTRRSMRATEDLERNFRFSINQKKAYDYTGSIESSNNPRNPVVTQKPRGSVLRLEVRRKHDGNPERKSIFFSQIVKKISSEGKSENLGIKECLKTEEVIEEKGDRKRVDGILTKELEVKYGIRVLSSESVESSDDEEDKTDEEEKQIVATKQVELRNSGIKINIIEDSKSQIEDQELGEEDNEDDSDQESDVSKDEKQEKEKNWLYTTKEDDIFSNEQGSFFQLNQTNRFLQEMKNSFHGIDLTPSPKKADSSPESTRLSGFKSREKLMVARLGLDNHIVQPEFMKTSGSMCFTEFWSKKHSTMFSRLMKDKTNYVKVFDKGREDELIYRPKRWREEEEVKMRIQRKDYTIKTPKNGKENIASSSAREKTKVLPSIRPDSRLGKTTRGTQETSLGGENMSQRTWTIKTPIKLVRRESTLKYLENRVKFEGLRPSRSPKNTTTKNV